MARKSCQNPYNNAAFRAFARQKALSRIQHAEAQRAALRGGRMEEVFAESEEEKPAKIERLKRERENAKQEVERLSREIEDTEREEEGAGSESVEARLGPLAIYARFNQKSR